MNETCRVERSFGRVALVAGILAVIYGVVLVVVDNSAIEVGWIVSGIGMAWVSGVSFASRRGLMQLRKSVDRALGEPSSTPPDEREALLVRLNESAAAYPDLWRVVGVAVVPLLVSLVALVAAFAS